MKLLAEIDGATVPLDRCHWVEWEPCGCPRSTMWASPEFATEEAAWKDWYPRKRDRDRAVREGSRMELMTHDKWCTEVYDKLLAGCPHEVPVTTATAGKGDR